VVLRNYEGMLVRYQAEDKPPTIEMTATRGVSSLLQGSKSVIIPQDNERMARRKPKLAPETSCGGGHPEVPVQEKLEVRATIPLPAPAPAKPKKRRVAKR